MTREEAINEIKSWDFLNEKESEAVRTLIPELRDSEDEKVRKDIVKHFERYQKECFCSRTTPDLSIPDALVWLEKQKEQRLLNVSAASEWLRKHVCNYVNSEYNEFHKCVEYDGSIDKENLISDFEEAMQKEQKPNFDIHWENGSMVCGQKEQNLGDKIANAMGISSKVCDGELKPADNETVELSPYEAEFCEKFCGHRPDYYTADCWKMIKKDYAEFKEIVKRELSDEQKPAEWSKEDEKMIGCFMSLLQPIGIFFPKEETKTQMRSWLKALRPQKKWKPSEEQMKVLDKACHDTIGKDYHNALRMLQFDLETKL